MLTNPQEENKKRRDLQGITLRRLLRYESKNRKQVTVYIEREFLEALPSRCDLNFEVNLALEQMLTRETPFRITIVAGEKAEP